MAGLSDVTSKGDLPQISHLPQRLWLGGQMFDLAAPKQEGGMVEKDTG
jgi:hypothetical protein